MQSRFILYTHIPIYIQQRSYLYLAPPHFEDKVESVDTEITAPMIDTAGIVSLAASAKLAGLGSFGDTVYEYN
jgi:hypothetical protein